MNIVVVGMGYVGIPSAALFADVEGFKVIGIQRRSKRSGWKIDYLNQGKSPIEGEEPGLEKLIRKVVKKGTFRVTDDISAYEDADVILIDVQTPVDESHHPRYESLKHVSKEIGERIKKGTLIGIESTVAPGTTNYIVKPILEKASGLKAGKNFNLTFSYERVMVGRLLYNLQYMPRIIGGYTPACAEKAAKLYKKIVKTKIFTTDSITAEISKVTENAYRDVNIAFANEIALICESLGSNVHDVRKFVNSLPHDPSDPAKNPYRMMMIPGAGVGGHCLPKDSWLLKYGLDQYGKIKVTPKVIMESRKINDYMPNHMEKLIIDALNENNIRLEKAKICILGFAFIENSDDTRNTPALPLYNSIKDRCKEIVVHDPYVRNYENVKILNDLTESVKDKDCIAIVTKHKEYVELDIDWIKNIMACPIIIDGRNIFDMKEAIRSGFTYRGVGIGKIPSL